MECEDVVSPADCCVWHANVHICFSLAEVSCQLQLIVSTHLPLHWSMHRSVVRSQYVDHGLLTTPSSAHTHRFSVGLWAPTMMRYR